MPNVRFENREKPILWVTRLRNDWVQGKKLFNRNNYRDYRPGERVRSAMADFNDPDGGLFRMRVIELERAGGNKVYFGASQKLREQDWKPQELADLYLNRWPAQEANFRAVNQAIGFKDVHGYGKRLIDNVSVVTELDKLEHKIGNARERMNRQQLDLDQRKDRLEIDQKELERCQARQKKVETQINKALNSSGSRFIE